MLYEFDDEQNLERAEAEAKNKPTAAAYQRLGDAHLVKGRIEIALERYRKAITLTEDVHAAAESRSTLGDALIYADQPVSALRQFRRAVKQSPRRAAPHFSLGEFYRRYGKMEAALIEFRRAIECDPRNAFYHFRLGDCLADAGFLVEAVAELETANELAPNEGFYHFWLSDFYLMIGRLDDAIREMQQAAMFAPYDDYYNMRLSILYLLTGAAEDAIAAIHHALALSPANTLYHHLLGDVYKFAVHDEKTAKRHYAEAGALDDYDIEHLKRLRRLTGIDPA